MPEEEEEETRSLASKLAVERAFALDEFPMLDS